MQFLILAYDAKDAEAPKRRTDARDAHLKVIAEYKSRGHMIVGAALLNEEEKMIGSVILADFADRAALDQWLENDPYITEKVWKDIMVMPCRMAPSFVDLVPNKAA